MWPLNDVGAMSGLVCGVLFGFVLENAGFGSPCTLTAQFSMRDWSGSPMKTPTLAGTRPGGAISAAWAVMNVLGVDGYREKQGLVCATREQIEAGVKALIHVSLAGAQTLGKVAATLAYGEGLQAHAMAAEFRLKKD